MQEAGCCAPGARLNGTQKTADKVSANQIGNFIEAVSLAKNTGSRALT